LCHRFTPRAINRRYLDTEQAEAGGEHGELEAGGEHGELEAGGEHGELEAGDDMVN
jgi:hypothetical protein